MDVKDALQKAAVQVPALVVLVALVWINNTQLERMQTRQSELQKATNEVLRQASTVMDRCERTFGLDRQVNAKKPSERIALIAEGFEPEL